MVTLDTVERPARLSGRQRRLVIGSVLLATLVGTSIKLWWAATTVGTNDVRTWQRFADGVRQYGPIGFYGHRVPPSLAPYNHPPLVGRMLQVINVLTDHGFSFPFLIRLPATAADIVTPILLYQLIRQRRSVFEATVGALACALSPVLLVVSGFHGNTDPAFVMFAILSLYLLTVRESTLLAFLAGISFAVSLNIKLVPIVVLPVLLVLAWRAGGRRLIAFLGGVAVFMAPLWIPVAVYNWGPFRQNVIGYAGFGGKTAWGLIAFMRDAGLSAHWFDLMQGPGRFVALLLTAGVPALITWLRPRAAVPAFGLSLAGFLLLTPTFGTQYLAWAAAATLLINVWVGIVYNAAAGFLLVIVYDRWNGAYPWNWDIGRAVALGPRQTIIGQVVWVILLVGVVAGMWWSLRDKATDRPGDGEQKPPRFLNGWRTNLLGPASTLRETPTADVKG